MDEAEDFQVAETDPDALSWHWLNAIGS